VNDDRFAKLVQSWSREAREDHCLADRLHGVEKKLVTVRANTREAMANELARVLRVAQEQARRGR